jgi:hypothetical protein
MLFMLDLDGNVLEFLSNIYYMSKITLVFL